MSHHIGIGVRSDTLAVVLVQSNGIIAASGMVQFSGRHPSATDFTRALEAVIGAEGAKRGRRSAALHLAIGPAHAQLRRIESLPDVRDRTALTALVQENASSFFLKNGVPLIVSGVGVASGGHLWAAAFDGYVIDAAVEAAREHGLSHVTAVPVSVALQASAPEETTVTWIDGELSITTEFQGSDIVSTTRTLVPAGDALEATEIRDACGAVQQRRSEIRWSTPSRWAHRLAVIRRWSAAAALVAAAVVLAIGPTMRDLYAVRANEARVATLRARVRTATAAEIAMRQQGSILLRLHQFSGRRVGALEVLTAFTNALPDSTAIIAFHLDSIGGTASLLGRDVMTAMRELQVPGTIASLEMTTPVLRESVGALDLQRVGIKYKLAGRP